jgi:5-methylcytosine-specific restriction endonuclease McrA
MSTAEEWATRQALESVARRRRNAGREPILPVEPDRAAELREMPYDRYLRTPEWCLRVDAKLIESGGHCTACGKTGRRGAHGLEVHHRTYRRRGDEWWFDLVVLCSGCHRALHATPAPVRVDKPAPGATCDDAVPF